MHAVGMVNYEPQWDASKPNRHDLSVAVDFDIHMTCVTKGVITPVERGKFLPISRIGGVLIGANRKPTTTNRMPDHRDSIVALEQ